MCGIFGYLSSKENKISREEFYNNIKSLFVSSADRGEDASGFFHPYIGVVKSNDTPKNFVESEQFKSVLNHPVPRVFFGHTRKPSTGAGLSSDLDNTQPLWSAHWIMAHNGEVEYKEDALSKEELSSMNGETDSKIILLLLEKYGIEEFMKYLKGTAAFIISPRNIDNQIYIFRDSRPLNLFLDRDNNLWIASVQSWLEKIAKQEKENISLKSLFNKNIVELSSYDLFKVKFPHINKIGKFNLPVKTYKHREISKVDVPWERNTKNNNQETAKEKKDNILKLCDSCMGHFVTNVTINDGNKFNCEICGSLEGNKEIKSDYYILRINDKVTWLDKTERIDEMLKKYPLAVIVFENITTKSIRNPFVIKNNNLVKIVRPDLFLGEIKTEDAERFEKDTGFELKRAEWIYSASITIDKLGEHSMNVANKIGIQIMMAMTRMDRMEDPVYSSSSSNWD